MATHAEADAPALDTEALEAGLDTIRHSPRDAGTLQMIVRRPAVDARERLETGQLDVEAGLVGDDWKPRGDRKGSAHPDMQITVMNTRAIGLIAGGEERWPLAGDQLYVDLDLSEENLAPGTRLAVGDALLEVTAEPHLGCAKFVKRFGKPAMKFFNSKTGRSLRLRGLYARVVTSGAIRVGDAVTRR